MPATKVVIVEDEPLFREMLRVQLSADPELEVIGETDNGEAAVEMARELTPEVMLMDIELGQGMTGIEAGYAIKSERPSTGIVLLSNHKAKQFIVTSGGWSYLIKRNVRDIDTVLRAVKGAAWGLLVIDPTLTDALRPKQGEALSTLEMIELKVLELLAQGYSNQAIARELVMEPTIVQRNLALIYAKLKIDMRGDVDPRVAAVRTYLEQTSGR
ncbi:MAG: response regulator transcription factor [Chloroflexi bacterium]|nr:response regulator transcription factor [Chloroflexota bacterium]MDA1228197.1 response regulator transcription factor [Chloroflexota bacterium]